MCVLCVCMCLSCCCFYRICFNSIRMFAFGCNHKALIGQLLVICAPIVNEKDTCCCIQHQSIHISYCLTATNHNNSNGITISYQTKPICCESLNCILNRIFSLGDFVVVFFFLSFCYCCCCCCSSSK